MISYKIAIAVLSVAVVILFCNWRFAKSCVKFWNMMYREEQRHNEYLFRKLKRLDTREHDKEHVNEGSET